MLGKDKEQNEFLVLPKLVVLLRPSRLRCPSAKMTRRLQQNRKDKR